MEDGSLRDQLDLVAEHDSWRCFAQIVAALGAMHGASPKVLHRDVKPENVLLSHVFPDDAVAAAAASGRGGPEGRGVVPTVLPVAAPEAGVQAATRRRRGAGGGGRENDQR